MGQLTKVIKETKMPLKLEELEALQELYADAIREYSRGFKPYWQQVPWLALQANGRTGYSGRYSLAYQEGLWEVFRKDYTVLHVDLATGGLVYRNFNPAGTKALMMVEPEKHLDAPGLVTRLEEFSRKPPMSIYNPEDQDAWREKMVKEYKLETIYQRRSRV